MDDDRAHVAVGAGNDREKCRRRRRLGRLGTTEEGRGQGRGEERS